MGFLKDQGVNYKPAMEIDLSPTNPELYRQANVKAPRMAGILVKVFAWFLELPFLGQILLYILKRNNLIHKLVSYAKLEESAMFVPLHPFEEHNEGDVKCIGSDLSPAEQVQKAVECLHLTLSSVTNPKFHRWTILDYSRAYTSGEITPSMVAVRIVTAIRESSCSPMPMSFFINFDVEDILRQAFESTLRYKDGEPLSVLDGVPIAIKDEIDCLPYPTTGGTKWLHKVRKCKDDASCVRGLKLCGAIIIGKTNMHELGAGTSGINPHYGATRNPYDIRKVSGGSSSGSAAVVSAGLCPAALGVDGGGSVRLPAALCGVIGFKPTFGRVPHYGVLPMNWTVGMVGILAGTIEDSFIVYAAITGKLHSEQLAAFRPNVYFPLIGSISTTSQVKLAKYDEWFNDCSDDIRACCSDTLEQLHKHYGWKVVNVTLPEIEVMRLAHYVTIGSECSNAVIPYLENMNMTELGWDARVALSVYGSFSSREYLNAQRIRNRQMQFHNKIFAQADVIVTPSIGVTAYPIMDDALETGELDYVNGAALVRYQIAGNFLGLPAVSVPVGYDKSGLPIGIQFIGRPWMEPLLIQTALAVQALSISGCKKPEVFYDLLQKD